jgi:hypothetical protein
MNAPNVNSWWIGERQLIAHSLVSLVQGHALKTSYYNQHESVECQPSGQSGSWVIFLKPPWPFAPFFLLMVALMGAGFLLVFSPIRHEIVGAPLFIAAAIFLLLGCSIGLQFNLLSIGDCRRSASVYGIGLLCKMSINRISIDRLVQFVAKVSGSQASMI